MYKTSFRVSLLVMFLLLPWAVVQAAGLGKLTINSALGQPLAAEIDIVTTSSDDVSSLQASVATREAYTQAGINYEPVLSTIKASIASRANGNPYVKLSSPQAVTDPFLMVLLELNWSSGRILREYTVLLDPVESNTRNLAAANINSAPITAVTQLNEEKAFDSEPENRSKKSSKTRNNPPGQAKNSYGPVKRGDTLTSIARQALPAGIDLNQMLVALYHANRDAFIADNMNLLKTGAVLKIPEKNEIASIDASTAKAEIKVQTADWRNYRSKLADISRKSPVQHTISQSDQGEIATTLDKKSATESSAPKEILKLSSGAQLLDKDGKTPDSALTDRLRMMEEDAIARNLALKEANERVAILEKSIENLKHLLELKDSVLAQAQLKAEPAAKNTAKPEVKPVPAVESSLEKDTKLESNATPAPAPAPETLSAPPVAEAIVKNVPLVPPPLPQDTEGGSWIDLIFGHIEYIGAALISGLLLALLIIKRRRKQQEAAEEEEETKKENFSSAMRSRIATMAAADVAAEAAADSIPSENIEDDLTYQNINSSSDDEEFDKDRQYYEDNVAKFDSAVESQANEEQLIADSQQDERSVDQKTSGNFAEDSQSTDSSYDSKSSVNQIDFDLSDDEDEIKHHVAMNQSLAEDEAELSRASEDSKTLENVSGDGLEINFDDSEKSLDAANVSDGNVFENEKVDLDFDLNDSEIDLVKNKSESEIEVPAIDDEFAADYSEKTTSFGNEPLEFDHAPDIADKTLESQQPSDIPELELAKIDLNLEDSGQEIKKEENPDLSEKSEQWQEIETKLDLAKAYQEMDDKEGAKEMLEEVIRDGDEKQKKAAKQMLKSL